MKHFTLIKALCVTCLFWVIGIQTNQVQAQLAGLKTVGIEYPTIDAFVTDVNLQGVLIGGGGVTLQVPAGYVETAPVGGFNITATGYLGDPIIINGGSGPNPVITANAALVAGTLNDAIFKIIGGDYITISNLNLTENAANTTTAAATNNMTEWGIALLYNTTSDGANNCSLLNNTITLNRNYQNTFGIYANATHTAGVPTTSATAISGGGNNALVVYGNAISNVNIGILVVGPTAATDHNDGIDIGGSTALTGNTITNFGTTGTFSAYANVSGSVNGILVRNSKNVNISRNTVTSSVGGTIAGTLRGIYLPAFSNAPTGTYTNTISNNNLSIQSGTAAGTVNGIVIESTTSNNTSTINIASNNFSTFGHTVAGTGAITFISSAVPVLALNVNNNTFTNMSVNTTGSVTFIAHPYAMISGTSQTFSGNSIVTGFTKTGAGGSVIFTSSNSVSTSGSTSNYLNNIVSNITLTGATSFTGLNNTDGGSASTKIITGNTIQNITGGTSALIGFNFTYWSGVSTMTNNIITGFNGQGTITGINIGSAANNATSIDVSGNTITSLLSTGTGGTVIGIACSNTSALVRINANRINTLATTGASTLSGIVVSGATNTSVFGNKIYDLAASNASGAVNGMLISGGTSVSAYNNVISDLRTPNANAANPLNGINVTGGTAVNLYYNSVYLSGTSVGALFGSNAISGSSTPNLTLANNIFINETVPTGAGIASAYRRTTTTLTSYNNASNRNMFYAGIPSASRLIMYDGTNSYQTLAAYQTAVATRDANSITGEIGFTYVTPGSFFISLAGASVDFLRPVAGITTQVESGGANIATPLITTDYSLVIRAGNAGYLGSGTSPDMGAYEFAGISPAPIIVLNSVTPGTTAQCATTPRNVSATITTSSGTIVSASLVYAFNGVPQGSIAMTNSGGNIWIGTLPVATPTNATVSWAIVATNSLGLNSSLNGTSYADDPTFGITASASANTTTTCANGPAIMTASALNSAPAASYTAPPAVSFPLADEDLGNITITQGVTTILNNTSVRNSLVGTIGTATGTAGSYSNFTSFGPFDLTVGGAYNFSVSSLQDVTAYTNAMAIYIDYNRNGVFTDPGEQVYTSPALISGAHTRTGSFTVPATAASGLTRMRVISNETTLISSPTQAVSYGEYEEYAINLVPSFTVTWMDGVTTIGTTNPITVNPVATTTYTAVVSTAGCPISPSPTVTINVNPLPSAPTAVSSAQCGTQVPTASVASTSGLPTPTFVWYDMPTGGTVQQSDVATTYLSNVATTTTFYVSELNTGTGCESARTAVTVTVASADGILASTSAASICIGGSITLTATNTNPSPNQSYTYSWDGIVGSGVGTGVPGASISATPIAAGTYTYSLTGVDGGCSAVSSVVVTVNPFVAAVTAVNVSCNGYNNGSFTLASSSCGTLPYQYDVDGGGFSSTIPTNLAPGAHTVIVRDANMFVTSTLNITITEPSTVIPAPTTTPTAVCLSNPVANVSATATLAPTAQTLTLNFGLSAQPLEVSGLSTFPAIGTTPNIISTATMPALPAGAVVTSATLNMPGLTATGFSWASDFGLGLTGAANAPYAAGTGAVNATVAFSYTRPITPASINVAGGAVNLNYYDLYNDNAGSECTFPIGAAVGTLVINYTVPTPTSISWWSASTGGTMEGTGSPFNAVGTTVLPNSNTPGTYTLYAQGEFGGCSGLSRTPVTVTVNPTSASTTTMSNCASYTWTNGTTYTTSGMYTQTLTNSFGCDSIATLDLTILNASASTTTASQCASYTWTNGTTYTTSGMYTQTLMNAVGCDSIATLDLTILSPSASTTTIAICDTYTWTDGNTYTASGMYMQTLTNSLGCDSIATLDLTINSATAGSLTMAACDTYDWEGTTYTASGTYTATLVNSAGCDSIATLNLTINTATSGTTTMAACDSYMWEGTTYTASGTYTATLVNSAGCDSLATLVLTINTTPTAAATDNGDNTITSSSATGNQWINCTTNQPIAGATSQTYAPTANGTYAVIVTGTGGCADTSSCVTISTISIDEFTKDYVNVYPNPTLGAVTIDFPYSSAVVTVIDGQGKMISESVIVSGQDVSLMNCERGMYYFTVTTEGGSSIHKVVKQ